MKMDYNLLEIVKKMRKADAENDSRACQRWELLKDKVEKNGGTMDDIEEYRKEFLKAGGLSVVI